MGHLPHHDSPRRFTGLRIAVTGGTSGLGLALVRELLGRGAVVLNVSSDAAVNPYPSWGAYGASKAGLRHLSAIWDAELTAAGVRFLSIDPGDMDTPLHAAAAPDADPATLKRPEDAARELADAIGAALPSRGTAAASPQAVALSGGVTP